MTGDRRAGPLYLLSLLLIVFLHFGICLDSMWNSSAASDEPDYIGAGIHISKTGYWRTTTNLFHPPFSYYLNSIPLLFMDLPDEVWRALPPASERNRGFIWYDHQIGNRILSPEFGGPMKFLRAARLPFLVLSVLFLLLVAGWTRKLFGDGAALGAAFLYALSPDILANARFVGTDLVFAFLLFAWFRVLLALDERFTIGRFFGTIVLAGCALGTKVNGLFALPPALLLLFFSLRRHGLSLFRIVGYEIAALTGPFLVVWALYGFEVDFYWEPGHLGRTLPEIAARLPAPFGEWILSAAGARWPLASYLRLLGQTALRSQFGDWYYLMGEASQTGWWFYFPIAWLVKNPLPVILLVLSGIVLFFKRRETKLQRLHILFPLFIILAPAVVSRFNIGIRHILPAYPFLFVIAGAAIARLLSSNPGRCLLAALLLWLAVGAARIHPSHLSYFNELAGGIEGGEWWLSDSNIDFGEDFLRLAKFQKANGIETMALAQVAPYPAAYYGVKSTPFEAPASGWIATEVMPEQMGIARGEEKFLWLSRQQFVARVGGSIKVYKGAIQ